ncbi:Unknown protein sequence [Pseudomonas syringae pv. cilantro]|nr:Unknown protein sequence [Pseudomonas syringae pv. cilantro]
MIKKQNSCVTQPLSILWKKVRTSRKTVHTCLSFLQISQRWLRHCSCATCHAFDLVATNRNRQRTGNFDRVRGKWNGTQQRSKIFTQPSAMIGRIGIVDIIEGANLARECPCSTRVFIDSSHQPECNVPQRQPRCVGILTDIIGEVDIKRTGANRACALDNIHYIRDITDIDVKPNILNRERKGCAQTKHAMSQCMKWCHKAARQYMVAWRILDDIFVDLLASADVSCDFVVSRSKITPFSLTLIRRCEGLQGNLGLNPEAVTPRLILKRGKTVRAAIQITLKKQHSRYRILHTSRKALTKTKVLTTIGTITSCANFRIRGDVCRRKLNRH